MNEISAKTARARGLFDTLTPEQQRSVLAYDGEENHGDAAFSRRPANKKADGMLTKLRKLIIAKHIGIRESDVTEEMCVYLEQQAGSAEPTLAGAQAALDAVQRHFFPVGQVQMEEGVTNG